MKKILICLFLCFSLCVSAGDNYPSVKTSIDSGRFEIIQSPILRKLTFKLDKYTGKTYQLVKTSNNNVTWEIVEWLGYDDEASFQQNNPNKVAYQLFLGGITIKDTFLINILTGDTWQLFHDPDKDFLYWAPLRSNYE